MKAEIKSLFLLPVLIAALGLIPGGRVMAQTFTTLHSFTPMLGGSLYGTNNDGALPRGGVLVSGSTLYGTAAVGGSLSYGTVFKVNTDGSDFTTLHNFNFSDGAGPNVTLVLSGGTLYGTVDYYGHPGGGNG